MSEIEKTEDVGVSVSDYDDGPTTVYIRGNKAYDFIRRLRITKKKIFAVALVFAAAVLLFDCVAGAVLGIAFVSENGSKSFYKYAYGEEGLPVSAEASKWLSENSESVFIEDDNGEKLHALRVENENVSSSYAVICHQYGESAESMGEYARHFYELGFNLIIPDLRGHGKTEIKTVSMGWDDRLDIIKWSEYIAEKDENARIILFGVSLGGAAVAMAAGEELPENVRLAVADSIYSSVDALFSEYIKSKAFFPGFLVKSIASAVFESKTGLSFEGVDVVSQAKKTKLPILYIHGENDEAVPVIQSNDVFEVCEAYNCGQLIIEGGAHGKNIYTDKQAYWAEIDVFILENIGL